jgi:ketosteroid isomerase-like protein
MRAYATFHGVVRQGPKSGWGSNLPPCTIVKQVNPRFAFQSIGKVINKTRMKTVFLSVCLLLAVAVFSQTPKSEEKNDPAKEAIAVVNKLFDAMRAKDAEAMRSCFSAEGQLAATQRREGKPSVRVFNGEAFAKVIVETKGGLKERMYKPEAIVSGDLVLVRGRYGFYVDERFSHCGTNSFHLMRMADGWKIVNAASTIELESCEAESKAKQ